MNNTVMGIRLEMAAKGWHSEDRISDMGWGGNGQMGYSIWFSRWDWPGVGKLIAVTGSAATYHAHNKGLNPTHMLASVRKAAGIADDAITSYIMPPTQLADGTLQTHIDDLLRRGK